MDHAVRFEATGGPDVLRYGETQVGAPGAGEVRVRQTAIGLNFIDTYHRTGLYPVPLPSGIGLEAAGSSRRRATASSTSMSVTASPTAGARSAHTRARG